MTASRSARMARRISPSSSWPVLRAMPNMMVLRPSDATETVEAWRVALQHTGGPVGLVLTRQKLPVLDRTTLAPASGLAQGAYVLAETRRIARPT